ncbi:MAG: cobalamin biosynthesis protein, partial [Oscillospiraceae bacterium]
TLDEKNIPLKLISAVATIDIKRNEAGLLAFCRKHRLPLFFYSSEELMSLDGEFSASEFVRKTTGADNVCERSAALHSGGKIIVEKSAKTA